MFDAVIARGRAAVITGGASGIGLAAAKELARRGMQICLADLDAGALQDAASAVADAARIDGRDILLVPTDVAKLADVEQLLARTLETFGDVALLMNNAAVGTIGGPWADYAVWQRLLDVNLWGVINGVQTFVPHLLQQSRAAMVINTGSKQGITTPPGNAAYNVAKAGVKVLTEQLAHELRQIDGCKVSAHLLVPGFTFTGMTTRSGASDDKPAAAWSAEQVVWFMMERLAVEDFYIMCPDNQTTADMDKRRIQWAADDMIEGRPALSRWHEDYAAAFAEFMAEPR